MARLFTECEWTQEKIAERMGKRQAWVSKRLIFGRFLKFNPTGLNASGLTEGRFRSLWARTKGKEPERFEQVSHALSNGIPQGHAALIAKPGVRKAVLDVLADGKSYTAAQITASVEDQLLGITEDQVKNALRGISVSPPQGQQLKAKKHEGSRKAQYKLAKGKPDSAKAPATELTRIYEQVEPLIRELEHWGRSSRFEQAPGELLKIATKLKRLFEPHLVPEHA